uniref:Uncharacterized protein n=1 Tax=Anguilla anguilla TaxID=7936 RepID=A0A0E9R6P1_ANGAN
MENIARILQNANVLKGPGSYCTQSRQTWPFPVCDVIYYENMLPSFVC